MMEETKININYREYKNIEVREIKKVEKLLVKQDPDGDPGPDRNPVQCEESGNDIVLFGEEDFTFTVALAAIRGGTGEGIIATSYIQHNLANQNLQSFLETCFLTIKEANTYDASHPHEFQTIEEANADNAQHPHKIFNHILRRLVGLRNSMETFTIYDQIDCRDVREPRLVTAVRESKVVWFQCPWAGNDTYNLIEKFFEEMSHLQQLDNYLLIGIANTFPYTKNYELENWLVPCVENDDENNPHLYQGYKFVGCDQTFIEKLLKHGYHHCTVQELQHQANHVTLIFQKSQ